MSKQYNELVNIRGLPCIITPWYTRQKFEDSMNFMPSDDDLILTSFPKTGTTWLQYIILQVKSKGQFFPSLEDAMYKILPRPELVGTGAIHAQKKPRCYKTHFPYDYIQKNDRSKYIYIYRNPEDTFVSYYYFIRELRPGIEIELNSLFEDFITGDVFYGSYFKHVLSFFKHHDDRNLLIVSYEKLHANPMGEILKIAQFMGEDYYETLLADEQLLSKITENVSFSHMKKSLSYLPPSIKYGVSASTIPEKPKFNFFRRGVIGDGKSVLSEVQRRRLKAAAEKILKGTAILDEWYPEHKVF